MKAVYLDGQRDRLEECHKIRYEVFEIEQKVSHELEFDDMDESSGHVIVYTDEGEPAATARLIDKGCGKYKIGRVAALKKYRKQGYGEAAMKLLIDKAKAMKGKEILIEAQLKAVDFYKKLGFKEYGEVFLDAGIEHRRMNLYI